MIQGFLIWLLTSLITYFIIGILKNRNVGLDRRLMMTLFFFHSFMAVTYYIYAVFNPSDSRYYYGKAVAKLYGDNWFDYFGTSTKFVDFISFFLVNRLGFTYESSMMFFAWLGFLGFLFFYIFFKERIRTPIRLMGFDAIWVLFLLPNMHFWSSSLGKGSLIFFGFGLFFFAINKPGLRFWALIIGGWVIFQIRPHIFYVVLLAIALGYTFSTKGVAIGYRIAILSVAVFLLYYIYEDIMQLTGLDDESIMDPLISHRASELSKATSGINIANYSVPEKLFAFWFRPLFFDSPGILGFIVSFENLFYLIFFLTLLRPQSLRYLFVSDAVVKTCLLTFLGVSFALAQISGNLGIALRQKSQVMLLMLFVILKCIEFRKLSAARQLMMQRKRTAMIAKLAVDANRK
jgi:hypothetical protein